MVERVGKTLPALPIVFTAAERDINRVQAMPEIVSTAARAAAAVLQLQGPAYLAVMVAVSTRKGTYREAAAVDVPTVRQAKQS
jgi:hypothetical protein